MNSAHPAAHTARPLTLPATGARAISLQAVLLLAAAYALPAAAHAARRRCGEPSARSARPAFEGK